MIPDNLSLVIFDADGTLRVRIDGEDKAPLKHGEWTLKPGVKDAIDNKLKWRPVIFGIASNQACVGRGEVEYEKAFKMLEMLGLELRLYLRKESIRMCPHLPGECDCRKPQPKMLDDIMIYWDVLPGQALFIGDSESDYLAAERAGCHFMYIEDFLGKE